MNQLSRKLFIVALSATAGIGLASCTNSDSTSRELSGTIPSALTSQVKTVRAIGVSGRTVNAPVVNGAFTLSLPRERTVLVFVDSNNKAIANLRFAGSAGGALQTLIPAAAATTTIDLGDISIQGNRASSANNILTALDSDDDGDDDYGDSDDDNDGADDDADDDADGDGTIDDDEDLDGDDDGDCDNVDDDDDNDGDDDADDEDDDNDGDDDGEDPDSDDDGVDDDEDADDDNDGIDDSADDEEEDE